MSTVIVGMIATVTQLNALIVEVAWLLDHRLSP